MAYNLVESTALNVQASFANAGPVEVLDTSSTQSAPLPPATPCSTPVVPKHAGSIRAASEASADEGSALLTTRAPETSAVLTRSRDGSDEAIRADWSVLLWLLVGLQMYAARVRCALLPAWFV